MTQAEINKIEAIIRKVLEDEGVIAKKEQLVSEEEAAQMIGVTKRWMQRNGDKLPRTKIGRSWKYTISGINKMLHA